MRREMAESRDAPADGRAGPRVGLLNEKPLHAALKLWYAEEGDQFEVPVDGFVADILRDGLVIEIQTGSASRLKRKIAALLRRHKVRLVLPVASRKTIVRVASDGMERSRRASPRRATALDAFRELVSLGDLLGDPNLVVDVVLAHEEEVRVDSRHRKGFVVGERRLAAVDDCVSFDHPADYLGILPSGIAEEFTTADLARVMGQPRWMAQKVAYVLRTIGVIRMVGKSGRAFVYRRSLTLEGP